MLLPVSMAEKDDGSGALLRVGGSEVASDDGLNAENFEEAGSHAGDYSARGLRRAGNGGDVGAVLCDRLEAAILVAKVVEVRVGQARPGASGIHLEQRHDPVRLGVRQGAQQDAVYHAEDGGSGADGQGECEDGDGGESGAAAQHPEGVTDVLK